MKVMKLAKSRIMTLPETTTPEVLAQHMGWSERRVRNLARRLGACRILGNRMSLLKEDVEAILEAAKCPSSSTAANAATSGTTGGRLPEIGYEDLLAQMTAKPRHVLRPRSKAATTNVISMDRKRS